MKTVRRIGDMTVWEYTLRPEGTFDFSDIYPPTAGVSSYDKDRRMLLRAIALSRFSEPCATAYRVGCVIEARSGELFEGYTHETGPHNHAEEEAVAKALAEGADLCGATAYTSMEPCSTRASKPVSCSEIIMRHRMGRVVYAYAEPDHFVRCDATRRLAMAGITVSAMPELAHEVIDINSHILCK